MAVGVGVPLPVLPPLLLAPALESAAEVALPEGVCVAVLHLLGRGEGLTERDMLPLPLLLLQREGAVEVDGEGEREGAPLPAADSVTEALALEEGMGEADAELVAQALAVSMPHWLALPALLALAQLLGLPPRSVLDAEGLRDTAGLAEPLPEAVGAALLLPLPEG